MIGQALKALARPAPVQVAPGQVPVMSVRDLYGGAARACRSTSTRARSSASTDWSAAAARRSPAPSPVSVRPSAGRSSSTARRCSLPTPTAAVAKRIAYLTEDRRLEGFVKDFDNGQNMSLVVLPKMATRRCRRRRRGEEARSGADRGVPGQGRHQDLHPHPERRQPAEGRGRQVDGDRPRLRRPGRADQGHRRRRPRQHLRDHPQPSPPAAKAFWWSPAKPRSCCRCATASW